MLYATMFEGGEYGPQIKAEDDKAAEVALNAMGYEVLDISDFDGEDAFKADALVVIKI